MKARYRKACYRSGKDTGRNRGSRAWTLLLAGFLVHCGVYAAEIQGEIQLQMDGRRIGVAQLPAQNRISVVLYPAQGQGGNPPPPRTHTVVMKDKIMQPAFLTIRQGDSIRFVNEDDMLHHLHGVSVQPDFSVPLDKKATPQASRELVFAATGSWHLYCGLHNSMSAQLNVVASNHIMNLQATGEFSFSGLEPGTWTVEAATLGSDVVRVETEAFTAPPRLHITLPLQVAEPVVHGGGD